jgi:hypothetical protein
LKTKDVLDLVGRAPFRPFKLKLTNGAIYRFPTQKFLGNTQDGNLIYWFGPKGESVLIDSEAVAEVSEGKHFEARGLL